MSLTYIGVLTLLLAYIFPIEEASVIAEAILVIVSAGLALYGRYRVGGLKLWGTRE